MFIRCLETGFQEDNIASKMRSVLKDKNIADEDLIQKLNEVVDAENERQTKLQPVSKTRSSMQQLQRMLCLVMLKRKLQTKSQNRNLKNQCKQSSWQQ